MPLLQPPRLFHCLVLAAALFASPPLFSAESAATLYTLNCRGCHLPPDEFRQDAPKLVGQFAQTEDGRVFFIELPPPGTKLGRDQDARLRREILTWKTSCHVILQDAPLIRYTGASHVK